MDETSDGHAAVRTRGLTKRYGEHLAVDSVSLTVRRGEVYGFLGPNGAGKTTTLRMVLGLIRPSGGTATVLGRPAGSTGVNRHVGALIEGPGFYPYLSGRDNLRVLARYRAPEEDDVGRVLERVGLTPAERLLQVFHNSSGAAWVVSGMAQAANERKGEHCRGGRAAVRTALIWRRARSGVQSCRHRQPR